MNNASSNVVGLDALLDSRRVWRGQSPNVEDASAQPTGHAALDAQLPFGGWPDAALTEILSVRPGLGELTLLWPTLARLTAAGERVILIAPPYLPYPHAWLQAGVDLGRLSLMQVKGSDVLWTAEQCLRSGSCGAVLCWPGRADDRALRRLQVAAETGQTLAFAFRHHRDAVNASPAALRLVLEGTPLQLRVLKCRGGNPPAAALAHRVWH
ncbi:translesion DNA synthesis-associated protein ImuA [Pseudomonas oryzihabitans]|uniref:translesion DNA synthesis-associated protein ImuA n=1 Tax=Pseudomonas oryzihabitans TaxID=47885 RepID=UPI0009E53646|nr:translesion DNA synthesis-associated protein ImuA [Pseudomonas oryzihabitans]